uniref:Achaete-scute A2 transcription factor n=1 Tax=Malacoceros fuliginosus TaxID=271776 RepID=A0A7G9UKX3_MALFL|nr:achaete-scute A2 transcription factor [Malacoceros fuliginosus]
MSLDGHYSSMQSPMQWGNNCSQGETQHWQQYPVASSSPVEAWNYPAMAAATGAYPAGAEVPRVPPMYHHGLGETGYQSLQQAQLHQQQLNSPPQDPSSALWNKQQQAACNLMDASAVYMQHFSTHATTVARRNERERNRVRHINSTFENLRQHLPNGQKKKKLSKVDTLRTAIKYIHHLQGILGDDVKPLVKQVSKSSNSNKKRQSLDSSVTSNSSLENTTHEDEELQRGLVPTNDIISSRSSPVSASTTPVSFLNQNSPSFQWGSS